MTGSWKLFLLCSLLQGAGCNAAEFEALMPASVATLSGSCVTVPCNFTLKDEFDALLKPECKKMWYQIKDQPISNQLISSTTFRGELTAYNCTTTFNNVHEDNGQYYFRIQCDGSSLKYDFSKYPVTIRIKGDPDAPRLTAPKEPMVEGTPVELRCSAPSYCDTHPPTVTWTPALGLSTQLQQDDTMTSTLTFNASHLHHGNNVSCTAAYYIPSGNKTVTSTIYPLSISYAPRNTSAVGSPCLPAGERGCLNLTCTSHANPAVSMFTWYRIHGKHNLKIGSGSSLSVKLWNANYVFFCEARNGIGTEKSNVYKTDIKNAPRNPSAVGSPCLPAREGGCLNLTCTSHANPAVSEVTWYRMHGEHIPKIGSGSSLSVQLWNANDVFFCEVRNDFGTEKSNVYKVDIQNVSEDDTNISAVGYDATGYHDATFSDSDQLPWIAATAVLAAGLLFAAVCAVRAWKMANRTRLGSDALLNKAPPNQGNSQVFFRSGEDIYANIDTLMNTVGPREEPVGAGGEAAGLGEGAVGLGEGADCDVLYTTVKWKKKS